MNLDTLSSDNSEEEIGDSGRSVVCCLAAFYLVGDGFIVKCPAVFVFYV